MVIYLRREGVVRQPRGMMMVVLLHALRTVRSKMSFGGLVFDPSKLFCTLHTSFSEWSSLP